MIWKLVSVVYDMPETALVYLLCYSFEVRIVGIIDHDVSASEVANSRFHSWQ